MTNSLYLVFSEKPDHVGRDEYHRWYADHAQENIESPRFVSAQRYSVQEIASGGPVGAEQHLALYEFAGEMSEWRTDLNRRLSDGSIVLPDWFKQITFKSWACTPEGGLLTPQSR
jgi:hypothetical protein